MYELSAHLEPTINGNTTKKRRTRRKESYLCNPAVKISALLLVYNVFVQPTDFMKKLIKRRQKVKTIIWTMKTLHAAPTNHLSKILSTYKELTLRQTFLISPNLPVTH